MGIPALKEVQAEALKRANLRRGFGFFMEQGLMKTGTFLHEFHIAKQRGLVDGAAVITLNSLKQNWADEVQQWDWPFKVGIWPQYDPRKTNEDVDLFMINYEAIISQGNQALDKFIKTRRVFLGADEASRLKTHTSQTSKAAINLAKDAAFVRPMTGTPMSQNVMDLWPIYRVQGDLNGVNPYAFRNRYAVMGGYMGRQIVGIKKEYESELHDMIATLSFRALKKDWLKDLPEKLAPVVHDFEMTTDQKMVYNEMRQDFYTLVKNHEVSASQVINQMEKLGQIGRGFLYDENGKALELVDPANNPAVRELKVILEGTSGKAIIVTVHQYVTDMLAKLFPDAAVMAGKDQMKRMGRDFDAEKNRFNRDPLCRHVIMQTSVGAYGHTMLAGAGIDRCATTIFFENTYSLEKREQMEDRNHRQGQDRGVSYFDLSCSPMDRKVIKALHAKKNMVAAIVDAVKTAA